MILLRKEENRIGAILHELLTFSRVVDIGGQLRDEPVR